MPEIIQKIEIDESLFSIMAGGDLREMCRYFYVRFGFPVFIHDTNLCYVACWPEEKIGDKYWDSQIENGGLTAELLSSSRDNQYMDMLRNSTDVLAVDWGDISYPVFNANISVNNRIYGYTTLECTHDRYSRSQVIQIARLFARCCCAMMMDYGDAVNSGDEFHGYYALRMLLSEHNASENDLMAWLRLAGIEAAPGYAMLCLHCGNERASRLDAELSRRSVRHMSPQEVEEQEFLFFIYGVMNMNSLRDNVLSLQLDCPAGYSELFGNLTDVPVYAHQAAAGCRFSMQIGSPVFFPDHQTEIVLKNMKSRFFFPSNYTHPLLKQLSDYDRQYNTELTISLITFVRNYCNLASAANELCIHRNSLAYRLERIKEISGYDLNSYELRYDLLLSTMLLDV